MHGSLPCTVWCLWQLLNAKKYGPRFVAELNARRLVALRMLRTFLRLADRCLALGGSVTFEWPRRSMGWAIPDLVNFLVRWNFHSAIVDGCAVGLTDNRGQPFDKHWQWMCSDQRVADRLSELRCPHEKGTYHVPVAQGKSRETGFYP